MSNQLKVGLLVGRERSFPEALIAEVNRRNQGVTAEYVSIGGVTMEDLLGYRVLVDRISHDVPFYQPLLKYAALQGAYVINNPFWRIADDKFFGAALAHRLGVAVPKTVVLPNHSQGPDVSSASLRNLIYPLDWERVVNYVGLPAILKPHWGGGWRHVHMVHDMEELWRAYDSSGRLTMILQEFIQWDQYIRCLCIGQENILPVRWDPTRPHFERYMGSNEPLAPELHARVVADARSLNRALGYDMNTVEFGVRDGIPYAIDFMNSAPDFDISSLTVTYFDWVVQAMADLVITKTQESAVAPPLRWDAMLSGTAHP